MDKVTANSKSLYHFIPTSSGQKYTASILTTGRYLVGRAESCDIIIPNSTVSSVHAVLEVTQKSLKIYDMNSKNGTFFGGSRVVVQELALGDSITFGEAEFRLKRYEPTPDLPPVLGSLEPEKGKASIIKSKTEVPKVELDDYIDLPKVSPVVAEEEIPYIVYPLAADPSSDYSEYIFEDTNELYPIFKYDINKQSVEVMILFQDRVYSVDYLPLKNGTYKIAGLTDSDKEVEFPYLAMNEKVPFVEVQSGNCVVHQLHNYELLHLVDDKVITQNNGTVNVQGQDIVKLKNGELELYVRLISAPPKVKPAPFFRRDSDFKKYIFFVLLFIFLPLIALNLYEVDEELKDEKDPERIATILYKQKMNVAVNKSVEKTKKEEKKKRQKAPTKPVVKKQERKKKQATSTKSNQKTTKKTSNPGNKTAKKQEKVKRVKDPAPKRNNRSKMTKTSSNKKSARKTTRTRRANVKSNSVGKVDVYKSFNFKSTVSNLMAKGGTLRGAKTAASSSSSLSSAQIAGGVETSIKKANAGTEVGSFTGSTVGKLSTSKGTEGLSAKTGVYTAGIPSETVVQGSMDPDVIRRILRDNIPFFRSCYQKELDRRSGRDVSGTIRMIFTIGASGHVSRAGIDGRSNFPPRVKRCVIGVLKGIKFPRPLGGGTVDVKQPFNFMPKRL